MNCKKGFTLIELIIVIAVLGILSAIAIPKFNGIKEETKKKVNQTNVQNLLKAAQTAMINGDLSENENFNLSNLSKESLLEYSKNNDLESILVPKYLDSMPVISNTENSSHGDDTEEGTELPEWGINTEYKIGDIVTYNDKTYKCIQAHTTTWDLNWVPTKTPALWSEMQ